MSRHLAAHPTRGGFVLKEGFAKQPREMRAARDGLATIISPSGASEDQKGLDGIVKPGIAQPDDGAADFTR